MSFLDRITGAFRQNTTNSIQINNVSNDRAIPSCRCGWDMLDGWRKKGFRPFGQMYLYTCMNQLYNGVSNITLRASDNRNNFTINSICNFIDNNANLLLNQYLYKGYIAIRDDGDNHYSICDTEKLRKGQNGEILNKNVVVYYSPSYQSNRKAPMDFIKPILETLDNLSNTMLQTTDTMGVLPIISGDSIPANPDFKENLAKAMSKDFGWSEEQMKYFLSRSELKVDTIDLKVKELELRDNILATFKVLLNFMEVPVDLVIGNSTYANVESARIYFYDTTIRKYAEIFLKVAQGLLTHSAEYIPKNAITYSLYNVHGLEKTLSDMSAEKGAYVDLLQKLADNGVDVRDELEKVFNDIKILYKEV